MEKKQLLIHVKDVIAEGMKDFSFENCLERQVKTNPKALDICIDGTAGKHMH